MEPPVIIGDSVTLIQEKIQEQSQIIVNFIGSLQRDAPPVVVMGLEIHQPPKNEADMSEIMKLPKQIVTQSVAISQLISQLPNASSAEDELQEIIQLQEESNRLDAELQAEVDSSQNSLLAGLQVYQLLGKYDVHARTCQPQDTPQLSQSIARSE